MANNKCYFCHYLFRFSLIPYQLFYESSKVWSTSVANPDSLSLVIDIIQKSDQRQLIIVSALSGITDLLSIMAERASKSEKITKEYLITVEERHKTLIDYFIPVTDHSEIKSF